MANPVIRNVGLEGSYPQMNLADSTVIDGTAIAADGYILRGTVLVKNTTGPSAGVKWHPFVHGTDTLAADGTRIVKDDVKVSQATDGFSTAFFEGLFVTSAILDANPNMVLSDLTTVAGFHVVNANLIRLK